MITKVYFDLDNTLWDFRKNSYQALKKLYKKEKVEEKFGISFQEFYPKYSYYNELLWEEFRDDKVEAAVLKRERFAKTFQDFGIDDPSLPDFFNAHYLNEITHFNHLIEGSIDLLNYLQLRNLSSQCRGLDIPHHFKQILKLLFQSVRHQSDFHPYCTIS